MPVAAIPPGGALTFTLSGLPSTPTGGRIVSGILSLALIVGDRRVRAATARRARPASAARSSRRGRASWRSARRCSRSWSRWNGRRARRERRSRRRSARAARRAAGTGLPGHRRAGRAARGMSALELAAVGKIYAGRRALHGVTARFEAGRVAAVLGPNGAGKTTLLGILSTLLSPSSGTVRWDGERLDRGSPLRSRIGYVGHEPGLYGDLTARENLRFFCALHGRDASAGPRGSPAGARRPRRRARRRERAHLLARHAAAAGAGAGARPRPGAAAVRRAVVGAGSGGRRLAAGRAGRRARRRPHRRAGDARSGSGRGHRRSGGRSCAAGASCATRRARVASRRTRCARLYREATGD